MKATKGIGVLLTISAAILLLTGAVSAEAPAVDGPDYTDPDVVWRLVNDLAAAADPEAAYEALAPDAEAAVLAAMRGTGESISTYSEPWLSEPTT